MTPVPKGLSRKRPRTMEETRRRVPKPASTVDAVAGVRTDAYVASPARLLENVPLTAGVRTLSVFELHEPVVPIDDGKGVAQAWAGNGEFFPVFLKPCRSFQLVREVLCNLLASAVGLPVPRPVLLDVSSAPEGRRLLESYGEGKFAFGVERRGVDLRQVLRRNRRTSSWSGHFCRAPLPSMSGLGTRTERRRTCCSKVEASNC